MDRREVLARDVCARLHAAGHEAVLAGGCVRDRLLGVVPQDYDIATSARPEQVQQRFARSVPVGIDFGVVQVLCEGIAFEVATFRCDGPYLDGRRPASVAFTGIKGDASRRDFTINALYYDTREERVIDLVNGQDDLRQGIVRTVGDPAERFAEDKLRLLRAVRFAARLGYTLDPHTAAAIRAQAGDVTTTSAERIRDELVKMLCEGAARAAFEWLDKLGLLREVLPEIDAMHGCEQPPEYHPEGDVFVHTMIMLGHLRHATPTLALGVLLHDVGKPRTAVFKERWRFPEHDKVGAEMAVAICERLRFSREQTRRIAWLVAQHMRFAHLPDMGESKRKRFVREAGFDELVELCRIDCLSSHRDLRIVAWVLDYLRELPCDAARPAPLLTGHDLIAEGYAPGPHFAQILGALEDAQLEGWLTSREAALDWVRTHWPGPAAATSQSESGR